MKRLKGFYFILSLFFSFPLFSQDVQSGKWSALFNSPFDKLHVSTRLLWDSLHTRPDNEITAVIKDLEKNNAASGAALAKCDLLKSIYCRTKNSSFDNYDWKYWGNQAISLATRSNDDYVVQSCCIFLGDAYLQNENYDTAVFYLLKSVELSEKLGFNKTFIDGNKIAASNVLYRTQNYRQCINFCNSSADPEKEYVPITVITAYNNTGLSYLRLHQPDSAIYFFSKAVSFCNKIKWGIWEGILSGNIGDALHEKGEDDKAMPYWQKDYDSCMKYGETGNAGLTLAYMSQYEFNHGMQPQAIRQLQWAESVNNKDAANLIRIYKIKGDCYRKMGRHDSADYFLQQHYRLSDSLNLVVHRNNYNTVQLRMAFDNSLHESELLRKERETEVTRRNLLLASLLAILFAGLLLYNRQRLKIKLTRQQKEIAEAEKNSAKEQLQIFTQTLLEKNEQIEELTASLKQQTIMANDELIHQTLLTEYDWNRFKELFEKTHPDFFNRIKTAAPGITQSEMRLAALIKLNLDNKQMASMQGISVSSLRGNKTRLRQKLNISAETDLEELIKNL